MQISNRCLWYQGILKTLIFQVCLTNKLILSELAKIRLKQTHKQKRVQNVVNDEHLYSDDVQFPSGPTDDS